MFIYMSKKIAIPKQSNVTCLSWNHASGYIAVGGEEGMLKVLKLESGGSGNLSMNLSLEGHSGQLRMAVWNEVYQKLTTSDEHGVIIVWMLYKGSWYEEMINNRNKSTVTGMAWGSDGHKICIAYEDGAVIVGSVDGSRVWGKDVKGPGLAAVQWSPDNALLLFALTNAELHLYDEQGNFMMVVSTPAVSAHSRVVAMEWFAGRAPPDRPALAVCYSSGLLHLLRNCIDDDVVVVETGVRPCDCRWNHDGAVLAVAGAADRANIVHFYSARGQHLRSLRVPGGCMRALSWEGRSLRVAVAVDSYIYFASVKPDHKYAYYGTTLAYCSAVDTVTFWDTDTHQSWINHVGGVVDISGAGEYCVIATAGALVVSNQQGIQCDALSVSLAVARVAINSKATVVAASDDAFLVWRFCTPARAGGPVQYFELSGAPLAGPPGAAAAPDDPAACVACSDSLLLLGRRSGHIVLFSLVGLKRITSINISARPYRMGLNCNSTKFFVIDHSGNLNLLDTDVAHNISIGQALRKDVWGALWAGDDPAALAAAERARLYVLRGEQPEEPLTMHGYLCEFKELEITTALLDSITDKCGPSHTVRVQVKSLRDSRQLLEQVGLKEAEAFIKDNPHPRLWLLLAEAALRSLESPAALDTAEAAFVRRGDYGGVRLAARLRALHSPPLRRAEVLCYFRDFDAAEKIYHEEDRGDLAIALRKRLGHWFRVVELLRAAGGAGDAAARAAYDNIADHYIDRQEWSKAVEYYKMSNNIEGLKKCYMALEDNEELAKILADSPRHRKETIPKSIGDNLPELEQSPSVAGVAQLRDCGRLQHAAAMALQLANTEASQKASPVRIKKLYVLAGHLYAQNSVEGGRCRQAARCYAAAAAAHWLGAAAARARAAPLRTDAALRAAAALAAAAPALAPAQQEQVWCTVALIAIEARAFKLCSKAFVQLEALNEEKFSKLAVEVFTRYQPRDARGGQRPCPRCQALTPDWHLSCGACGDSWAACAVSGRALQADSRACPQCGAGAARAELVLRRACAVCHSPLSA